MNHFCPFVLSCGWRSGEFCHCEKIQLKNYSNLASERLSLPFARSDDSGADRAAPHSAAKFKKPNYS